MLPAPRKIGDKIVRVVMANGRPSTASRRCAEDWRFVVPVLIRTWRRSAGICTRHPSSSFGYRRVRRSTPATNRREIAALLNEPLPEEPQSLDVVFAQVENNIFANSNTGWPKVFSALSVAKDVFEKRLR